MQRFRRRSLESLILVAIAANVDTLAYASDAGRLYAPCAACHQPDAGGSLDGQVPNLAGQQQQYLEKQLALLLSGARAEPGLLKVAAHTLVGDSRNIALLATAAHLHMDLAPPEMAAALGGMSSQEKDAIADYSSRSGESEVLLDAHRFNREDR